MEPGSRFAFPAKPPLSELRCSGCVKEKQGRVTCWKPAAAGPSHPSGRGRAVRPFVDTVAVRDPMVTRQIYERSRFMVQGLMSRLSALFGRAQRYARKEEQGQGMVEY